MGRKTRLFESYETLKGVAKRTLAIRHDISGVVSPITIEYGDIHFAESGTLKIDFRILNVKGFLALSKFFDFDDILSIFFRGCVNHLLAQDHEKIGIAEMYGYYISEIWFYGHGKYSILLRNIWD